MRRYLVKKIINILLISIVLSFILFFLLTILPGKSDLIIYQDNLHIQTISDTQSDDNLIISYIEYVKNIFIGNFGTSTFNSEDVLTLVIKHIEPTLLLALLSISFSIFFAVFINYLSYKYKKISILQEILIVISYSLPSFVLALFFILLFGYCFNSFFSIGYISFIENPLLSIKSLLMPSLILTIMHSGFFIKTLSNALNREMKENYIVLAKSKGLKTRSIYFHALKNMMIDFSTVIFQSLMSLLTASCAVEYIFALPGLGSLTLMCISRRDLKTLHAILILYIVSSLIISLLNDVLYCLFDKRVKLYE